MLILKINIKLIPFSTVTCVKVEDGTSVSCVYDKAVYPLFRLEFYLNQITANMTVTSLCPECITETDIEGLDYGVMYTFDFTRIAKNLTGTHTFIAAYKPEAMNNFFLIEQCCNKTQQIQYQTEIIVGGKQ